MVLRLSMAVTIGLMRVEKGEPMREKLIDLLDETVANCMPSECLEEIADHLIANGVTITPAVPGPKMGHNMAEVCYRNGEEAMRGKVINFLLALKSDGYDIPLEQIEKVRKL